jgi:hypothetical protein
MTTTLADIFGSDDQAWMSDPKRNCSAPWATPDDWFPTRGLGSTGRPEVYAAAICSGCSVINQCATFAIQRPELEGIWGGLTEGGRKQLRCGAVA